MSHFQVYLDLLESTIATMPLKEHDSVELTLREIDPYEVPPSYERVTASNSIWYQKFFDEHRRRSIYLHPKEGSYTLSEPTVSFT